MGSSVALLVVVVPYDASSGPALTALVLGYVGPDQMLPLASALGAILGVLLIVWHRAVAIVRKTWRWCLSKLQRTAAQETSP